MNIKSRILEFLPKDLIIELNTICYDVLISDNNTKVNKMVAAFDKYDVDYSELGPGTNRFAILIDGYVFKIAMDKDGVRDNLAEFSLSQELQPFVIKVYECNGLIIVTEYVTVISKEEFINNIDEIRHTLSYLSQGYLLGDVGSVTKNFMNWGYRDDGSLVILDFAYIYRVLGEEMICGGLNSDGSLCTEILEYDADFNNLICPKCRKSYTFHEIRRKISRDYERKELEAIKQIAYKVTKPNQEFDNNKQNNENNDGGHTPMSKQKFDPNIDANESYLEALDFLRNAKNDYDEIVDVLDNDVIECDEPIAYETDDESEDEDSNDEIIVESNDDDSDDSEDDDSEDDYIDIVSSCEDERDDEPDTYDEPADVTVDAIIKPQVVEIATDDVIILTTPDADIDEMRRSLLVNTRADSSTFNDDVDDSEYDEYDHMHDDADEENLNYRMHRKHKKEQWSE